VEDVRTLVRSTHLVFAASSIVGAGRNGAGFCVCSGQTSQPRQRSRGRFWQGFGAFSPQLRLLEECPSTKTGQVRICRCYGIKLASVAVWQKRAERYVDVLHGAVRRVESVTWLPVFAFFVCCSNQVLL
jgi:hypothetical protein